MNLELLELFKGTGSVGKVAIKMGFDVVSVDLDPIYTPIIETDILDWNYKKFQKDNNYTPNFIWASPPCNTFSPLVYRLYERNPKTAEPKSERARIGTKILYKTLEIIEYFLKLNPNLLYVIENPRGMMRNDKKMLKIPYRITARYCLYGDIKNKPTDFWSNYPINLKYKGQCENTIGVQDLKKIEDRYSIPSKLIKSILVQGLEYLKDNKPKNTISYNQEIIEGSGKNKISVELYKSPNKNKKYRVVFYKDGEEFKHTDFGAEGGTLQDFTEHKDKERKERFLSRFNKLIEKNKDNPYSPMTLSHLVLWNKPTLKSSWNFYKKKFGFKLI